MTKRPASQPTRKTVVARTASELRRSARRRVFWSKTLFLLTFGLARRTTVVDMRIGKGGRLETLSVEPESLSGLSVPRRLAVIAISTLWALSLAVGLVVVVKWIATGEPF